MNKSDIYQGKPVRAAQDFDVPKGTEGVIDLLEPGTIYVAWDTEETPLPDGYQAWSAIRDSEDFTRSAIDAEDELHLLEEI